MYSCDVKKYNVDTYYRLSDCPCPFVVYRNDKWHPITNLVRIHDTSRINKSKYMKIWVNAMNLFSYFDTGLNSFNLKRSAVFDVSIMLYHVVLPK